MAMDLSSKLVQAFYARVPQDAVLSRVYPTHLRCATESLTLYLSQVVRGRTASERSPFVGLRESHARFRIGEKERMAWLQCMDEALVEVGVVEPLLGEFRELFKQASGYLLGQDEGAGALWAGPLAVEEAAEAVRNGDAERAITLVETMPPSPGLLALMSDLATEYVKGKICANPELVRARFGVGHTLLHDVREPSLITLIVSLGADANALNRGGHPPLYSASRAESVKALLAGGAAVNARSGVQLCTALHMASRRGNVPVARALVQGGADVSIRDKAGATPLQRAINCRKHEMVEYLSGL